MPKILFIAAHRPDRSPSQRYRFEQYFGFLEAQGYTCELSWLLSERDDALFYSPGIGPQKLYVFLKGMLKRFKDIIRAGQYDIVFVQREAFMTGSVFFEKRLRKSGARLVYDFDDAIWHLDVSEGNKRLGWLKRPGKTADIIALADVVIAGNNYLCSYAKRYNSKVRLIPTTIDTIRFSPASGKSPTGPVCIGWSGSLTTIKHFEHAIPFLKKLKDKYGKGISFTVMCDDVYVNEELEVKGIAWSNSAEVAVLSGFDIGIMPLPDDEWVKGKCGLKGLSYMSLEVPTVMSDVGVNGQIIQDGLNGFLAANEEEWIEKISRLVESETLRRQMGQAGRKTVIERYSVLSQQNAYLEVFQSLLNGDS